MKTYFGKSSRHLGLIFMGCILALWACQLTQNGPADQTVSFTKRYDSLAQFDSVHIVLKDMTGHTVDIVYRGKVDTLSEIEHLPAPHWDGGKIIIDIIGYKNGQVVYKVDSYFNGASNTTDSTHAILLQGMALTPEVFELQMMEGDSIELPKLAVAPENLSDKSLRWISSNPALLTVGQTYLKAKHRGLTQLTVKLNVDSTKTFVFSVTISADPKMPDSLRINPKTLALAENGAPGAISIKVYPLTANPAFDFKIEDSACIKVSANGTVQGLKKGTSKIWAISKQVTSIQDSAIIVVAAHLPVEKVAFLKDSIDLFVGGSAESLVVDIIPPMANPDLEFRTADSLKVAVDGHRIIGLAEGHATIIATSKEDSNKRDTLRIIIFSAQKVDSISVNPKALSLFTGGEGGVLMGKVYPLTLNPLIQWRSSDPLVASVDGFGKVVPVSPGTASISAQSRVDSSKKTTINVVVKRDMPMISVGQDTVISIGQSVTVLPAVVQEYGQVALFKWDLNGDGVWDDSAAGLKPVTYRFDLDKECLAAFYVRDTEGNDTIAVKKIKAVAGPVVLILSPLNNTYTRQPTVAVAWSINGKDQDSLLKATLTSGPNIISRSARDAAGNLFTTSVTVNFDTLAPEKPLVHALALTNSRTPTWTWGSGGGGTGIYRARLDLEDFTSILETKDTLFSPATDILEGSHTLFVQERDAAGNWSGSGRATLRVDYTPPGQPLAGVIKSPTNNPKPTWNWTSGGNGGQGIYRYKLDESNFVSGAITVNQSSVIAGANLNEGLHTLYVQERDSAGNWSPTTSLALTVDLTPPAPPVMDTLQDSPLNSLKPVWSWKSGGGGGAGIFRYRIDNAALTAGDDTSRLNNYTPATNLTEGRHSLYVQEQDSAGNWSTASSRVLVLALRTILGGTAVSSNQASPVSLRFNSIGDAFVAYNESGSGQGVVKRFTGSTWLQLGDLSTDGQMTISSFVLNPEGVPYIVGVDTIGMAVFRFNQGWWERVGSGYLALDRNSKESVIATSANGELYVAFRDPARDNKTTVLTFNGITWDTVGSGGFSMGYSIFFRLLTNKSGIPYVAYIDAGYSPERLIVQRYNALGSKWEQVGNASLHSSGNGKFGFSISSSDSLYLSAATTENGDVGNLFKFDGSSWVTVGNQIFGLEETYSYTISTDLDSTGRKFIAYQDISNGNRVIVKVLKGNQWISVGSSGYSATYGGMAPLSINSDGVPYVIFSDANNGNKVTVLKMPFDSK